MLRRLLTIILVGAAFVCLPLAAMGEIAHWPTELTYYDSSKAYNGVTMWPAPAPAGQHWGILVDMEGRLVHKVNFPTGPGFVYLLENGNFLISGGGNVLETDWNGITKVTIPATGQHHDFKKVWNKFLNAYTYMYVSTGTTRTAAQALAWGSNAGVQNGWYADSVVRGTRTGISSGNGTWTTTLPRTPIQPSRIMLPAAILPMRPGAWTSTCSGVRRGGTPTRR